MDHGYQEVSAHNGKRLPKLKDMQNYNLNTKRSRNFQPTNKLKNYVESLLEAWAGEKKRKKKNGV